MATAGDKTFGSCCAQLKDAIDGADFEPLITVGEDGVLYMGLGMVEMEDGESGMVDHPIFFCPFCGTRVQTPEEVDAKIGAEDDAAGA
jgi:hypothetical protein